MPLRLFGLCSGASSIVSSIPRMTSSSTRTERMNRSPPCVTRWPTASISAILEIRTDELSLTSHCSKWSSAARWSRSGAVPRAVVPPDVSKLKIASPPMRSYAPRARRASSLASMRSGSVCTTWNLSVDDPALRTRTFISRSRAASLRDDHATGNARAAIPGRISRVVIGTGVDDDRRAVGVEERVGSTQRGVGKQQVEGEEATWRHGDVREITSVGAGGAPKAMLLLLGVEVAAGAGEGGRVTPTDGVDVNSMHARSDPTERTAEEHSGSGLREGDRSDGGARGIAERRGGAPCVLRGSGRSERGARTAQKGTERHRETICRPHGQSSWACAESYAMAATFVTARAWRSVRTMTDAGRGAPRRRAHGAAPLPACRQGQRGGPSFDRDAPHACRRDAVASPVRRGRR